MTEPNQTRVITVRLPAELHESLCNEAHDNRTSLNQLCIAKLRQAVPSEAIDRDCRKKKKVNNVDS